MPVAAQLRSVTWKAVALCAVAMAAAPAALAAAPKGLREPIVLREFELVGTNGYEIEVSGGEGGGFPSRVSVLAKRGPIKVSYEVEPPGPGLQAVFGDLGQVAMRFERHKRSVSRAVEGCPLITETGVFRGQLSFVGEGGYTSVDATSAEGEVTHLPKGICGFRTAREGLPDFLRTTELVARSPIANGFVEFRVSRLGDERMAGFVAEVEEVVGAMTISRKALKSGPAFVLGPGKRPRRASVDPPSPFIGNARFADPAGGPPTWTGSLSISLPGAPTVALAGSGFRARLCPSRNILAECNAPGGSAGGG